MENGGPPTRRRSTSAASGVAPATPQGPCEVVTAVAGTLIARGRTRITLPAPTTITLMAGPGLIAAERAGGATRSVLAAVTEASSAAHAGGATTASSSAPRTHALGMRLANAEHDMAQTVARAAELAARIDGLDVVDVAPRRQAAPHQIAEPPAIADRDG